MRKTSEMGDNNTKRTHTTWQRIALASSLALFGAACTPTVTINDIYGNQDASAPRICTLVNETDTVNLRPSGNPAGPSSVTLSSGATLTLVSLADQDGTKAANIKLSACDDSASTTLKGGETGTLTIGTQSVTATVSISYDPSGPLVGVTLSPTSDVDSGVAMDPAADSGSD